MSEGGHKRKRSLQDSTVDISKMSMALTRLDALKDELEGIEETEENCVPSSSMSLPWRTS